VGEASRIHLVQACCVGTACDSEVETVAESVTSFASSVTSVAELATSFAESATSVAGLVNSVVGSAISLAGESNPVEAVGVPGIMMVFSLLDPTRRQEARCLSGASKLIRNGVGTSFGQ
jgi:hypothetical protein